MPDDGRSHARVLPFPLLWLAEITPVLDAQDFVQGVLTEGSAAVIYGDSNAGKTFWTIDLALHVAAGLEWNGRRVDQGGVIYCALEGGNGFRNRAAAWRENRATSDDPVPFAAIPSSINLLKPEADTPRLISTIQAAAKRMPCPVKLVVVDTLSRALSGGNENAPDDMGALVLNMDRIRAEAGAALLFVHHSGKDAARGARGHNLLRAAIDTEIEVVADETKGVRTATVVKQRDLPKGTEFSFRLEVVTLGQNQHDEPVTTCLVAPEAVQQAKRDGKVTLTENERGWLRDLNELFAEPHAAELRTPLPEMPAVLTLTREQVRVGYRRRGRLGEKADGPMTGAQRQLLSKNLNVLKDKRKIGLTDELVWLL